MEQADLAFLSVWKDQADLSAQVLGFRPLDYKGERKIKIKVNSDLSWTSVWCSREQYIEEFSESPKVLLCGKLNFTGLDGKKLEDYIILVLKLSILETSFITDDSWAIWGSKGCVYSEGF